MNSERISTPPGAAGGPLSGWLQWTLIFAVFFIVGGAPAPHVNEAHYLTKAKHYWDPSYCPGDFFLDSADAHVAFYWTFGWLTKWLSLPAAAWIGRIAAWGLLAAAWQRLARTVLDSPWFAPLSAALWVVLIDRCNFAGEWVVGGVEAKCFAYALVLAGLADVARGQWRRPWIWFGLAATMHVLVGAWAVLAALGVWLTEPRTSRPSLRTLLPALLVGAALSLPGLLPALALDRGADPQAASEAARIYVFKRLPHHLAPLSLPPNELALKLARFGLLAGAMLILWAWSERRRASIVSTMNALSPVATGISPAALERMFRFAGVALAANALGLFVEAALVDRPAIAARVLRYYWFRQADVAVPLAAALAGAYLSLAWLRTKSWRRIAVALAPVLFCVGVLSSVAVDRWKLPIPPALNRLEPETNLEHVAAWQDACRWIDRHTPPEACFIVPRAAYSFKWYASRADVANWKDVPQDAAGVVEWHRRCQDLFPRRMTPRGKRTLDSPEKLGTERLLELARRYSATHVIARSEPALDLPVAYSNAAIGGGEFYTIYETGQPASKSP